MTWTSGSTSAARSAFEQLAAQRVVQRVALLGPVEREAADAAAPGRRRGRASSPGRRWSRRSRGRRVAHLIAFGVHVARTAAPASCSGPRRWASAISATVGPTFAASGASVVEVEVVELRGVAGEQSAQLVLGHVVEPRPQVLAGVRVGALVVGVVAAPHEAVEAELRAGPRRRPGRAGSRPSSSSGGSTRWRRAAARGPRCSGSRRWHPCRGCPGSSRRAGRAAAAPTRSPVSVITNFSRGKRSNTPDRSICTNGRCE